MTRYTTTGTVNSVSQINAELEKIQESIKELLSRKGDTPNQMGSSLDMNNFPILNLPEPISENSPLRKKDIVIDKVIVDDVISDRKSNGVFNIQDYGAVPDNVTDNKEAIDSAIAALKGNGGGTLYIPPSGVFRTSGDHEVVSNMTIQGGGFNSCLKRTGPDVGAIFRYINPDRPAIGIRDIAFLNLRIEGVFDETGEEGSGNGVITLVGAENVLIQGCVFHWIETFCLNCNQCDNFKVINNDFKYIARDMVAIWGTPNCIVANNSLVGGDDDCISLNQARFESTNNVMRDGLIVTGNYLRDTGSIKIQQAKNTIISNNIIKLCKGGRAIFVEGLSSAQGEIDARNGNVHTVIIESNIITDLLDRVLSYKDINLSINNRRCIVIDSKNITTTELENPYDFHYSDSGELDTLDVNQNVHVFIKNNVVKKSINCNGIRYSDLGFGKMFSRFKGKREDTPEGYIDENGFVDPILPDVSADVRSLEIKDSLTETVIEGNYFQGGSDRCIYFELEKETLSDFLLSKVYIKNNILRDFTTRGIDLLEYGSSEQDVTIERNIIDGDPFLKDNGRNADGSWAGQNSLTGIALSLVKGVTIRYNEFKNCSAPFLIGAGNTSTVIVSKNIYTGKPDLESRRFSPSNKGLGFFPFNEDPLGELNYVESDPSSPDYLKRIAKQVDSVEFNPPTEGYYFRGQTVWAKSPSGAQGSILLGYRRITDGDEHVVGTDWAELFLGSQTKETPSGVWSATGVTLTPSTSTEIRGVAELPDNIVYLLDNAIPERLIQFDNNVETSVITDPSSASTFAYDLNYNANDTLRWITGNSGLVEEFDSSWTPTGRTLTVFKAKGIANINALSRYYVVSDNDVKVFNSTTLAAETAEDFSTGLTDIRGISSRGSTLYYVLGNGDVYSSTATGDSLTLELSTGLIATGISVLNNSMYVSTDSGAVGYSDV